MCSVVICKGIDSAWPLIIAANRDEMIDRPAKPPARHWPDRPNVTAGLDVLAGGSWMGLNDEGVVAIILNRYGTLGPAAGKRSRGELVLDVLDHADAADAADAFSHLDTRAYRPFNLVIADNRDTFVLCHRGEDGATRADVTSVSDGVHMLTAFDLDQTIDPRIDRHLPLFRQTPPPIPTQGDGWDAWIALLSARQPEATREAGAMNFRLSNGFGTVSSSVLALPAIGAADPRAIWRHCHGRPDEGRWTDVGPLADDQLSGVSE